MKQILLRKRCSEMDNDTLHLINDKVKKFMNQLKQNLKKILGQQIYNTNKIIVSQDFGGNTYSKNIRVAIQIK